VISRAPAKKKGGVCLLLALTRPFLDETPRPTKTSWPIYPDSAQHGTEVQYSQKCKVQMEGRSGGAILEREVGR
jgi:hypothetical protein